MSNISSQSSSPAHFDRFVVIHVATTCDEHGVYVTKDSAEVIELGWILLEAKSLEEVCVDGYYSTLHRLSSCYDMFRRPQSC